MEAGLHCIINVLFHFMGVFYISNLVWTTVIVRRGSILCRKTSQIYDKSLFQIC